MPLSAETLGGNTSIWVPVISARAFLFVTDSRSKHRQLCVFCIKWLPVLPFYRRGRGWGLRIGSNETFVA